MSARGTSLRTCPSSPPGPKCSQKMYTRTVCREKCFVAGGATIVPCGSPGLRTRRGLRPFGKTAEGAVLQVGRRSRASANGPASAGWWNRPITARLPLAQADPTLLAGVGESDRWLTHGPAARGPPLPQNDIRCTAPGWTRERDGVRVQGTRASVGCARRIPFQQRGPDKFSNLSYEAAAPPRVGERPSVSWLVEPPDPGSTPLIPHNAAVHAAFAGSTRCATG
jgi:hypothetical protein